MPLDQFQLLLLALPLLIIDWQIAIVWALSLTNSALVSQLQALQFSGFEAFMLFYSVGILRRWVFVSW